MARGGVAVATPIARSLGAPLDVFVARRFGVPGIEEVTCGAIAEGARVPVLTDAHRFIGVPRLVTAQLVVRAREELAERVMRYRDGRPLTAVTGRTVILVDDGLASGATLRAAALALRGQKPERLVAAVPVALQAGVQDIAHAFDEVVVPEQPATLRMVSDGYQDFAPVSDGEVRAALGVPPIAGPATELVARDVERSLTIPVGAGTAVVADLGMPNTNSPAGLMVFAHGGGSSRNSYRNRYLAALLRGAGWGTLRVDLLTPQEHHADATGALRFDIDHISARLETIVRWCQASRVGGSTRLVLLGASTGAAAAMHVAARLGDRVAGVVARGGRVDLARDVLTKVAVPVLLLAGSNDPEVLALNRDSCARLPRGTVLRIVEGAGHAFEEAGVLGRVGELVSQWLRRQYRWAIARERAASLPLWRTLTIARRSVGS